jgi:ParB family chromosome partitioning protein
MEEAQGILLLMERFSLSQEQAARMIGKSQSAVANKLRLLRHSGQVLEAIRAGNLSERHARALLKLPTEGMKLEVIALVCKCNMSVARTERYIEQLLQQQSPAEPRANVGAFLSHLSQSLARIQSSGIPAVSERRETDSQIVLTITIPK